MYSKLFQYSCGAAIAALSLKANPKLFGLAAVVGIVAQHVFPELSTVMTRQPCAAGCSGIAGESLGINLHPNLAFLVGTVLFCGHIDHCKQVSAVTVGTLFGLRVTHLAKRGA